MKKIIGFIILKTLGWKSSFTDKKTTLHSVIIAAPHTSNWDFIIALGAFWYNGIEWKFFIKDDYTKKFFIGSIFRWMGAIGVNRNKNNNLVEYAANLLKNNKNLAIIVPAEGTRKKVKKWKRGFYFIAKKADVPVSLGFVDFKKKLIGVEKILKLTDDFEKDMTIIENYYKNVTAKYPENYNTKIF